jgi:hypothetical protein
MAVELAHKIVVDDLMHFREAIRIVLGRGAKAGRLQL